MLPMGSTESVVVFYSGKQLCVYNRFSLFPKVL